MRNGGWFHPSFFQKDVNTYTIKQEGEKLWNQFQERRWLSD